MEEITNYDIRFRRVLSEKEKEEISCILKEKFQDPEFKKKHKEARQASEEKSEVKAVRKKAGEALKTNKKYQENLKVGIESFRNDPVRMAEYLKNNKEAYLKAKENPEYWENYYAAIAVRDADPEYHKKRIDASKKKICKKVHTPLGIFDSITDASKAYGMGNSETMRHRIKSPNFPDFYIIQGDNK